MSLSLGDLQWAYDWEREELISVPIGVQVGEVLSVAGQPMRFALNPQSDIEDLPVNARRKLLFTVTPILPDKK